MNTLSETGLIGSAGIPAELATFLELLVPELSGIPRGKTTESKSYDDEELPHLPAPIFFIR